MYSHASHVLCCSGLTYLNNWMNCKQTKDKCFSDDKLLMTLIIFPFSYLCLDFHIYFLEYNVLIIFDTIPLLLYTFLPIVITLVIPDQMGVAGSEKTGELIKLKVEKE